MGAARKSSVIGIRSGAPYTVAEELKTMARTRCVAMAASSAPVPPTLLR